MNRIVKTALFAVVASLAALSAQAQAQARHGPAHTPGIDYQQAQQQHRIEYGVQTGQLTAHEAQRLQREQHAIRRVEARARADGVVTVGERHQLHRVQYNASSHIYHQRHDRQTRRCHPRS